MNSGELLTMLNTLPKTDKRIFPTTYSSLETNFLYIRKRLAVRLARPQLTEICFKSIRHWGGTTIAENTNGNMLIVKQLLRHKCIESSMKYIHAKKFEPKEYEETTATTIEEIRNLGKGGWTKYDEITFNQVQVHFYRRPKRFTGQSNNLYGNSENLKQGAARANKSKESFEWTNFLLQFVKEDKDAFYYKVEALFPIESMNKDSPPFTREEVLQAARSLTGKPSDLNHDHKKMLEDVEVVAAQFEDDCVECLVRVLKTSVLVGMIDRKEIVNVSIEGEWSHGIPGHGLVLTGLGWLTKDTMLPGIPLTRIMPVEQIAESFLAKKVLKEAVKQESDVYCVFCSNPADYFVSICQPCVDKFSVSVANFGGVESLEEKEMELIVEKIALKVGEKSSLENEKLKTELSEAATG